MASTSAVEDPPSTEEHVFEEDIEEETVWMDEEEPHNFAANNKNTRAAYDGSQRELAVQETADEYNEVDVEEYDEEAAYSGSNLPELLSKRLQCENGSTMTICFSKKGTHQLALDGYLYNLSHSDGSNSTWVCINPECTAHILSTNEMGSLDKSNDVHVEGCEPDEPQLALRIAIYDLRLVAEFTDVRIDLLYLNFATSFAQDNPSFREIFPSFNALKKSLVSHRVNKIYRRNFDAQEAVNGDKVPENSEIEDDDEAMLQSTTVEVVIEESYSEKIPPDDELHVSHQITLQPWGKSRAFPPTYCMECGIEMVICSHIHTAQHELINHVDEDHHRIRTHAFVFEPAAFEMWLREVQRCPALRLRRFSLIGDDMFYLCSCDLRLPKSKYTKQCHCTAYVRILDYRQVSARKAQLVSIDYSFEHWYHDVILPPGSKEPRQMLAELKPDAFLFQLERRKHATANLVRSRIEASNRRQALANSLQGANRMESWSGIRMAEDVFSRRAAMTRSLAITAKTPPVRVSTRPCASKPLDPIGTITRRANFKDQAVYDSVRQFEQLSQIVIRRLQSVRTASVADQYSELMRRMVNRIVTDLDCAPDGSAQSIWSGLNPTKSVNPASKRGKGEEREQVEGERSERKRVKMREEEGEEKELVKEEETRNNEDDDEEEEELNEEKREQLNKDSSDEGVKGMKTRGRSQLPVKNTLMASARIVEEEKEGPQSTRRRTISKEDTEKGAPEVAARSKSSRIQARKEKIDG